MSIRFSLTTPPEVKQTSPATCWAAALEAWLKVTKGRTYKAETDIIAAYKDLTINDPSRSLYNGMSIDGLMTIAAKKEVNMAYKVHRSLNLNQGTTLTGDDFRARLKDHGHVYVVYAVAGGSHSGVVYGYDGVCSTTYPDVSLMDPGFGYRTKNFNQFLASSALFYGWPSK